MSVLAVALSTPAAASPPPRDTILDRGAGGPGATAAAGSGVFVTADGHRLVVRWSSPYGPEEAQSIVSFLGGLLHGKELGSLNVFLTTPGQIQAICGPRALACYSPFGQEMVTSGQPGSVAGLSREFLIAHEYGHHLARNRSNRPWPALMWGPKYWASQQEICRSVKSGRYDPFGYWDGPGEAFAETFAFLHYPTHTTWQWSFPPPNPSSYAALLRDVRKPWRKNGGRRFSGSLGEDDPHDLFRVATRLDGRLIARLRVPPNADFDLFVLAARRDRVLVRSRPGESSRRLKLLICGRKAVRIGVRRESGDGRYLLKVSRP